MSRGAPSRRAVVGTVLMLLAYVGVGIATTAHRYVIFQTLLGGTTDHALVYRLVFLAETATLVVFAGALVLHLFARRWWSTVLLMLAVAGMVVAVFLNRPPRRGSNRAHNEFVEQLGVILGDNALASTVFDASVHATFVVVVAALVTTAWAFGLRFYREWNIAPGSGAMERAVFRATPFVMWLYPFCLIAVLVFNANVGAEVSLR
ncbi:hypothetical protein EYE40_10205 [Glaciihabitans arcticus]|uniref:Uncharacterized protein n=1 Tax=Glaciihabitans arcticus TaxID=2668039 RepID=A0A4V2JF16_9MICO|nr:hypothetical protein [Glaciihabitans arcticus]TBN57729.1 hypothetical protein EYE40_10205 [Glaciihabitans arcticus]